MIDFLGIGAQKAGTSWLFARLKSHPQVRFPAGKEVHFWDQPGPHNADTWLALFPETSPEIRQGEITPGYAVLSVETIAQIHKANPKLRLFFSIRNPMARAWSAAQMVRHKIYLEEDEVSHQWYIDHFLSRASRKRGDFLSCLATWHKVFAKESLWLTSLDDIEKNPKQVLMQLAGHLDIDPSHFARRTEDALGVPANRGPDLDVPPELVRVLRRIYARQIEALGEHLRRDLSSWLEWDGRRKRHDHAITADPEAQVHV